VSGIDNALDRELNAFFDVHDGVSTAAAPAVVTVARKFAPAGSVEVLEAELRAVFHGMPWALAPTFSTIALDEMAATARKLGHADTAAKLSELSRVTPALYETTQQGKPWVAGPKPVGSNATDSASASAADSEALRRELVCFFRHEGE
jgi:hypothetical protein